MRSPHCRKRPGSPRPCASRRSRSSRRCPIPSQETEEWRYTDLSDFALDFAPYTPGGRAQNLDDVPADILAAAGAVGERAGLLIQHELRRDAVAPGPRARGQGRAVHRSRRRCRRAPGSDRQRAALARAHRPDEVPAHARRVPHRRDVPVRAARHRGRAAAADPDVARRRRHRGVPPHADRGGSRCRGDVHRAVRLAGPDACVQQRGDRDRGGRRGACPLRRDPGLGRRA